MYTAAPMKKQAKPGLKSIASELGVSAALVSKVLNNRMGNTGVSPVTAAMIRQKAQDLGYRKNHAAAALVTGKQNVIAGLVHSVGVEGSGITEHLVRGLAAGAAEHGKRLMLRFFATAEEFLDYLPEASPAILDGVIIAGVRHHELDSRIAELQNSGVPVVTVHEGNDPAWRFVNVDVDQVTIGRMATEHLISKGCRRIVHIHVSDGRAEGYRQAMAAASLPIEPDTIFHATQARFSAVAGENAVAHWSTRNVKYDGIVAQSDFQAIGAMNALLLRGVRVPADVKVIGVDNSPMCEASLVPLSSISSEHFRRGQTAVQLLIKQLDGHSISSILIEPVLYPRASTYASESQLLREALGGSGR